MGNGFRRVNACLAGDFGSKSEQAKKWIEAHGGTLSKELHGKVTHLITTQNSYRRKISIGIAFQGGNHAGSLTERSVQEAKKMKGVKIVSIDWLEDSLLHNKGRPKREGPYLFTVSKTARKQALMQEKVKAGKSLVNGALLPLYQSVSRGKDTSLKWNRCTAPRRDPETPGKPCNWRTKVVSKYCTCTADTKLCIDGYHVFKDTANLVHSALLIRPTSTLKHKEKHTLKVFAKKKVPVSSCLQELNNLVAPRIRCRASQIRHASQVLPRRKICHRLSSTCREYLGSCILGI